MDLAPTAEQEAFRAGCGAWLEANVEQPPSRAGLDETVVWGQAWQRRLARAGLVGVTWPVEYGGRELSALHHFIVQEELARSRSPELVGRIGLNLVGPTLLAHGAEQQKRRWLPAILDATELWCQLFSEPGAGSDLAGLTTRAVRDDADGGWRLHGQKL
ncbi:MAG: acyl-CoA dehydrogenase family protein, partial [Acidimicrobiales bacterium]